MNIAPIFSGEQSRVWKGNIYLLVATVAWGTTFVVQRTAMDHMGPFTYSGLRFLLGFFSLLPFALYHFRARKLGRIFRDHDQKWLLIGASLLTGILVCLGINLQQIGLISSTAGKGGFITGLYVVIVPILGTLFGQRTGAGVWIGALLALAGLYFLSVTSYLTLAPGDGWILACAFAWAVQVLVLGWLSPKIDSFLLALGQSLVCGLLSLAIAVVAEEITVAAISAAWFDLIYGGVVSVGIGYTLQVAGQKYARTAHAAIIMQFEAVFAVLAGWVFLGEVLSPRGIFGCGLMLTGMLVSGFVQKGKERPGADKKNLE